MMKSEFESLYGSEVSQEDYDKIIEPMYMATNLNKLDFVATLDKKRFALPTRKQMQKEMKKLASRLLDTYLHFTDHEAKEKLQELADSYTKRFCPMNSSNYISYQEHWSCFYPTKIEFFDSKTGHTFETIDLGTLH